MLDGGGFVPLRFPKDRHVIVGFRVVRPQPQRLLVAASLFFAVLPLGTYQAECSKQPSLGGLGPVPIATPAPPR